MPDIRESLHRAGQGVLSLALAQCRAAGSTMVLRVCGRPGGVFHLRQGSVVAVESPGAPGIETLLLRSGRISEADWAELVPAGRESRRPVAELVTRGHIGAAELQVVSAMALQDAVFAVLAGDMGDCLADPNSGPLVPVGRGEDPLRLLDDAVRKLAALAAMPHAVLPDRERVVVRRGVDGPAEDLAPHRKEILYLADGRRTPRDIAFMIGRGVYHVTVEISRMLAEGLLERVARSAGPAFRACGRRRLRCRGVRPSPRTVGTPPASCPVAPPEPAGLRRRLSPRTFPRRAGKGSSDFEAVPGQRIPGSRTPEGPGKSCTCARGSVNGS